MKKDNKILIAAMVTAFMTTFMSSALNLSIPALESYFGVSAAAISWVVSSYTISVAALSLPFGKIADITSRRKVFITGISGFLILSLASIFVRHLAVLIALRAICGACAAMIFATNNAILLSHYPPEMRGKILGLSVTGTYIGLTTGPVIGGILNSTLGWRSIFAVSVMVSCVALFAAAKASISESSAPAKISVSSAEAQDSRVGFDGLGVVLYVFSIIATLYGMSNFGSGSVPALILVIGLAALVLFFIHETKQEKNGHDPIMKVTMFTSSRTFTFSNLAALMNYGATFAISYMMSIYLQIIMGMPSSTAGLILIVMPGVQALFSPITGSLSDRIRPSILASSGMGICAGTLILLSRLGTSTPLWYVILALCLTGAGFGLFSSPNTNAIMSCVQPKDYSVANSINATMRTFGQSSSMAVLAVLTQAVLGSGSLATSKPEAIIGLMNITFMVFAGICIVGIFFSLARNK